MGVPPHLAPDGVDPQDRAAGGWGLGLRVINAPPRAYIGHAGSMPGFLAGMYGDLTTGVGAIVLCNGGYGLDTEGLCLDLIDTVVRHEPPPAPEWLPTPDEVEPQTRELLGVWHWGNAPYLLRYAEDRLQLGGLAGGRHMEFRRTADGTWRGCSGYMDGELLRAIHADDGTIRWLDIGTFRYTRTPYPDE